MHSLKDSRLILIVGLLFFFSKPCSSQEIDNSNKFSELSQIMLHKKYSLAEIEELKKYPEKLKTLNYLYSKSFEVSNHQTYTKDQFNKIDISLYDTKRKLDERVLVFDEASGLSLVLFSLNQIENDTKEISKSSIPIQNSTNKIPN